MTEDALPAPRGIVYLIGAGPGNPGLITARGRDLIESADAIVFDNSVNRALLPRAARDSGHPELFFVGRKRGGIRPASGEEIAELLVRLAREGRRAARLIGGDPVVFGRGGEEAQALNDASVPFEIVPGVTAGIAAISYAGIPVTHEGLGTSVTFVSGVDVPGTGASRTDWGALAKVGGTVVIYAGLSAASSIARALMDGGMPDDIPAAAVERGTRGSQRTVTATLGTLGKKIERARIRGPAVIVVGWPVILRDELSWFEKRPLFGKRIVIAQGTASGPPLARALRDAGAEVAELPAEDITRLDLTPLRAELGRLRDYKLALFSSPSAVLIFWEQLLGSGGDARDLAGVTVTAVGGDTAAALLEHGIALDIIPERFTKEGLMDNLRGRGDLAGSRAIIVGAEREGHALSSELSELGMDPTVVTSHRSAAGPATVARLRRALERGRVDLVVFSSAAAVASYAASASGLVDRAPAAALGPEVGEALRSAGIEVLVEATEPGIEPLARAIERVLT